MPRRAANANGIAGFAKSGFADLGFAASPSCQLNHHPHLCSVALLSLVTLPLIHKPPTHTRAGPPSTPREGHVVPLKPGLVRI